MLLRTLAPFVLLISSIQAFVVPIGINPDGTYVFEDDPTVEKDANGRPLHESLPDLEGGKAGMPIFSENSVDEAALPVEPLAPKGSDDTPPETGIYCGCRYHLDAGFTAEAVDVLKAELDRAISVRTPWSFYVIRGDVIAFKSWGGRNMNLPTGKGSDYAARVKNVTEKCGENVAGTYFVAWDQFGSGSQDSWSVEGYMRYYPGVKWLQNSARGQTRPC